MVEVPNDIPEDVYWSEKEMTFFDSQSKRMGGKFFDQWKDRREEFPQSRADTTPGQPRRRNRVAQIAESIQDTEVVDDTYGGFSRVEFLAVARARKALFDAYVEVGFEREEALELCVK